MATRKRVTIEMWIRDAMAEEVDGKKCSAIVLVHMQGAAQKEVYAVKFGSGTPPKPEDIAGIFRGKAEAISQDMPTTQTFQLLAFYHTNEPGTFHPFTAQPIANPDNPFPSEAATPEGQVQMRMRQYDALFAQTYRQQQFLTDAAQNMIVGQNKMLTDTMAKYDAMFNHTKELLMSQALNTHKFEMEQLDFARKSEERKKWIGFLPMLANTISNREIFPHSNADSVLLENLIDGLDEQTIGLLSNFIKPELMAPLMARVEQLQKKKIADREAGVKALTPPTGMTGEEDASGGKDRK